MSEEKFYVVKNDKGEYWDFRDRDGFWKLDYVGCLITNDEEEAKDVIRDYGGHIITLIEEPKKVKLPKKVAEWVDYTKNSGHDITDIFDDFTMPEEVGDWLYDGDVEPHEERGLMLVNAYQYGYTVEKENKYNVKVPHVPLHYWKMPDGRLGIDNLDATISYGEDISDFEFTESDIERYNLQDCEKEEVIDDGE